MPDPYAASRGAAPLVVVGAGVTGLTVAREVARHGRPVVVIERDAAVGGLARTFRYGDTFFDVGPHRFHTEDADVSALVREVVGGELLGIERASAVSAFGGLHEWPLRPAVLAALPPALLARCAADLVRRERPDGESFEAEIVRRYGRTLYDAFFAPYTRRFLDRDPGRVHQDWARAGMDRATIDRRVRAGGLWDLLRTSLRRRVRTGFDYPRRGVGAFAERLADDVAARGGRILLGRAVTALEPRGRRVVAVVAGGERVACDRVVWTGPLGDAVRLLGGEAVDLRFRSTLLVNVEVLGAPRFPYQWIYFGGAERFVRVSAPGAFSPEAAPPGITCLCA